MTLTPDQHRLRLKTATWRHHATQELKHRPTRDQAIREYAGPPHNMTLRAIAEAVGEVEEGRQLIGYTGIDRILKTQPKEGTQTP